MCARKETAQSQMLLRTVNCVDARAALPYPPSSPGNRVNSLVGCMSSASCPSERVPGNPCPILDGTTTTDISREIIDGVRFGMLFGGESARRYKSLLSGHHNVEGESSNDINASRNPSSTCVSSPAPRLFASSSSSARDSCYASQHSLKKKTLPVS